MLTHPEDNTNDILTARMDELSEQYQETILKGEDFLQIGDVTYDFGDVLRDCESIDNQLRMAHKYQDYTVVDTLISMQLVKFCDKLARDVANDEFLNGVAV